MAKCVTNSSMDTHFKRLLLGDFFPCRSRIFGNHGREKMYRYGIHVFQVECLNQSASYGGYWQSLDRCLCLFDENPQVLEENPKY